MKQPQDILNSSSYSKLSVMVQTRLLRSLTSWVFNTTENRDCTTFLSSWRHCWTIHMVKEMFPTSNLKLLFSNLCSLSPLTALNIDKLSSTSELWFKEIISKRRKLNEWMYQKTSFTSSKQTQIKAANIQDSVGILWLCFGIWNISEREYFSQDNYQAIYIYQLKGLNLLKKGGFTGIIIL